MQKFNNCRKRSTLSSNSNNRTDYTLNEKGKELKRAFTDTITITPITLPGAIALGLLGVIMWKKIDQER